MGRTAQRAAHIAEGLAGNLLVVHIVEDMAVEHCKEVRYHRTELVLRMVGKVPVDTHSVGHKAR